MKNNHWGISAIFACVLVLSACGGGGGGGTGSGGITYAGTTDPATADSSNKEALSDAATEGAKKAVEQSNAPVGGVAVAGGTTQYEQAVSLSTQIIEQMGGTSNFAGGVDYTYWGPCGGNAELTVTGGGGTAGTIVYNDYCEGGVVANGTVYYSVSGSSYTFTYSNFTIAYDGESYTINMTAECTISGSSYDCTYSSDFTGSNGTTYRVANVSVSGDNSSGYTITARVYDPDYGYVDIVGTNITICSNGNPGTGTVQISDSTSSNVIQVDFISCSQYQVTYDSNTVIHDW